VPCGIRHVRRLLKLRGSAMRLTLAWGRSLAIPAGKGFVPIEISFSFY